MHGALNVKFLLIPIPAMRFEFSFVTGVLCIWYLLLDIDVQWNRTRNRKQSSCPVAYPGIFFFWGGVQQIQSRTEDRDDGDLGAVAP